MRVLVTDNVSKEGLDILRQELEVVTDVGLSEDELCEKIQGFDALIVRSGTKVTEKVIQAADQLKVIGRAGVGVDNIDTGAATRKGVLVVNAPEGNTIAAAEHTVAMLLSLSRNIPITNNLLKQGQWERKKYTGVEVKDKVVGVVGFGKIGSEVAKRLKGLEMKVLCYDPYVNEGSGRNGFEFVDLETILKTSDYITLHVPMNDKTKNLISYEELNLMKPGARIINCARGGIVNEAALYEALKLGKIAGAALDVFEQEPPEDYKLLGLDNAVVTPHLAASTAEAQVSVATDVAQTVLGLLKNGSIKNAVNMSPVSIKEWNYIRPYMALAERMGQFYSQYKNGKIDKIEMAYHGDITDHKTKLVTSSVIKGLLNNMLDEPVNIVNAYQVARERGVEVKEVFHSHIEDYSNLMTLKVHAGDTQHELKGTVFSEKNARIVNIDDYDIDLVPEGLILLVGHRDQPGMIAKVSSVLGVNQVNIATMQVGRETIGGKAMMILSVDDVVPQSVLDEINALDGLDSATMINFQGEL